MRSVVATVTALSLPLIVPGVACADRKPTTATDGFFVGARLEPGVALLGGWDLDVYLVRDRSVAVGPGVTASVLSTTTSTPGQQQTFLLAADIVRLKIGPSVTGDLRPFVTIGGGFSYARFAEQNITTSGSSMAVALHYPSGEEFSPMASLGGGADWFLGGPVAVSLQMMAHYHIIGSSRMPDLWVDLAVGIRFGL
jgi:hypothetical protein